MVVVRLSRSTVIEAGRSAAVSPDQRFSTKTLRVIGVLVMTNGSATVPLPAIAGVYPCTVRSRTVYTIGLPAVLLRGISRNVCVQLLPVFRVALPVAPATGVVC